MKPEESPTIVLYLSPPPSLNKLWSHPAGRRGRVRSPEYSAWLYTAGWEAKRQLIGVPMIVGAFDARITVPEKSRRDRDSWTKAIFDLCQHVGAVRNDSGLKTYTVTASDRSDCMVALWDLGGEPLKIPKAKSYVSKPRAAKPTRKKIEAIAAIRTKVPF